MRALGRKYLAVWGAGVAGTVVAGVCAVLGLLEVAVAALAVAVLAVLVTSALSRLTPHRRPPRASSPQRESVDIAPVVERAVLAEHVRTQQYVTSELEQRSARLVQHVETVIDAEAPRVAAEVLAALRLRDRYGDLGSRDADGPTAVQTLDLLDSIRSLRPRRVLVIGAAAVAGWIGRELESAGGRATLLVDDDDAAARLDEDLRSYGLETVLTVTRPSLREPAVPHGVLPWYDLSFLGEEVVDLVVIGWAGPRPLRATLPVLPLLLERLDPAGAVAVVAPRQQAQLVESWTAGPDLAVDAARSSAELAVLRRVAQ